MTTNHHHDDEKLDLILRRLDDVGIELHAVRTRLEGIEQSLKRINDPDGRINGLSVPR